MSNNYRPDPFRDLFDDNELSSLFEDEEPTVDADYDEDENACPGCGGKGRYIGLFEVEDPCKSCGGTGRADSTPTEEFPRFPAGS